MSLPDKPGEQHENQTVGYSHMFVNYIVSQ